MYDIKVLSQEVADQIAAGEVAERPSSVVKELVENSMDAGADKIEVEIRKGGIEYIRISDNGCGISPDQVETAFLRHATSKLRDINDLYTIGTMGFRGEALASICAVAEVEVITKTPENDEGVYVKLSHGSVCEREPIACGDGTVMTVNNLFANIPARMKFLKRDATEAGYVADVLTRMALARPDLSITYICDGKEVFSTSGDGNLQNAILKLYGLDYAKSSIPVDYTEDNVRISGIAGKPELSRGNRTRQTLFVNNRYIKSHVASKVVGEAYRNSVMVGKFPFFVLNISIDPEFVDVNVHPAKTEIKFSNENRVYDILFHAVSNALKGGFASVQAKAKTASATPFAPKSTYPPAYSNPVPEKLDTEVVKEYMDNLLRSDEIETSEKSSPVTQDKGMIYSDFNFLDNMTAENTKASQADESLFPETVTFREIDDDSQNDDSVREESPAEPSMFKIKELPTVAGQIFDTYILCTLDEKFYMIDQHAAHERLRFENLKKSYYSNERMSQLLLSPIILKLEYSETRTVLDNLDTFAGFGFDIEDFGSGSIIVNATPIQGGESDIRDLILEICEAIDQMGRYSIAEFEERALDMISCKYAIKANHKLNLAEMTDLVERVWDMESDGIATCPHGRPIKIEFTKTEIEKMFKRIV